MHSKFFLMILLLFLINQSLHAQVNSDTTIQKNDTIKEFHEVSKMAQFPGGDYALYQFIGKNLKYPPTAFENEIQGTVIVRFIIQSDGSISDVVTLGKRVGWGIDEAAINVVKSMPNWEPAEFKGVPVPVRFRIPIKFEITGDTNTKDKKTKNTPLKKEKAYDLP